MTSLPRKPVLSRASTSGDSPNENDFTAQHEENPLEVGPPSSSIQHTPNVMQRENPMEMVHARDEADEPPPPYQELDASSLANAPQIAPIEYSIDNSPQLRVGPELEFMDVSSRSSNLASAQAPELSSVQSPGSPALNDPSLLPAPLQIRPALSASSPTMQSTLSQTEPTLSPQTSQSTSVFSSAKAREAGFEIEPPPFRERTESSGSVPSVTVLPSTEPLVHTREAGKVTAYLIPFPKPRIKGVRPEDIPDRFLIYTPLLPPLSKPAPGEKESHWHKTSRQWQEDVRKATMSKASATSWKGMKAKTTNLIHKGVNATRSSNVEFLDRVSGGSITSTAEEMEDEDETAEDDVSTTPASPNAPTDPPQSPHLSTRTSSTNTSLSASKSKEKGKSKAKEKHPTPKPQPLTNLTLIYPPSLTLPPQNIREEFIATLLRTREKSRKDALVASTLLPFAAALDASLIITLGGLTQVSGVWAYTSTRGVLTSRRMTKGLERGEEVAAAEAENEGDVGKCEAEVSGCTCGHHEDTFGKPEMKPKDKNKNPGINLHLQQSPHLEILRRYLDIACLKKGYHYFPQIEEAAGDIGEGTVLSAIGWKPVRRQGRDLEVEFKDGVKTVTPEEDETYQFAEAREDVRRYFRKGAAEWVGWCKAVGKDAEKKGEK